MNQTTQIASHLRQVHFGGSWTGTCLKDKLSGVEWQHATTCVHDFHSIATLVHHMNYYVQATIRVMQDGQLDAKDALSFDHTPIESQEDWENLKAKTWSDAEALATLIEAMPESQLWETFVDEKYGNFYRCLHGPIQHCHYHVGQIAIIKSLVMNLGS